MSDFFANIKTSANQVFVGLTGGIGSGKSTVAAIIREAGYHVLSADDIGRNITHTSAAVKASIREAFGEIYLPDGALDRVKMSSLVFGNTPQHSQNRERLNAIVHPAVWQEVAKQARERFLGGERFVFNESALLFETGADKFYDSIIVVDAPEKVRIARLSEGRNIPEDEARRRIQAQISAQEKRKKANFVIENGSTLEATKAETMRVLGKLEKY